MRTRFGKQVESLSAKTRDLQPLSIGDTCRVQNQSGPHPTKWDRTGVVLQVNDNDQYLLKMHGSGRVTLRNRKFLRKIQPLATSQSYIPQPLPVKPVVEQGADSAPMGTPIDSSNDEVHCADTPATSVTPAGASSSAGPPAGPPADTNHNSSDHSLVNQASEPLIHQTPPTTPPRSTRNRRPPAWHADYKMQ